MVCTTPSSLKSFVLKFVEAAHQLDAARLDKGEDEYDDDDVGAAINYGFGLAAGWLKNQVFGYTRRTRRKPRRLLNRRTCAH